MLIPPHVPLVLSKHAGAGDSADRPGPFSRLPSSLLLCLPWWPTHPRCGSSEQPAPAPPYLSPEPQTCAALRHRPPFSTFFYFASSPDLRLCHGRSFFDEGLCSHCRSTGSAAGLATVSSSSVVLRSHSGRRGLVIFQAWSV